MAQAQERLGVSAATLQRIVRSGRLAPYQDPRNKRVRLLKATDVDRLMQPLPEGKVAA
jgi:excisionase family DNA binding protein